MTKRVGIEVSLAVAEAARLANVDVVSAYPITPQTHIVERLAEMVANGELDAEFIPVESEHSAMSACLGSAAVGARTFTATAGQGLELMHEVLYIATAMRLPIVMAVANRALSGPLNVWGDHSDVMATRDVGWIQVFAENGQEAFDLTLWAFRVAEDPGVLLPTMVNLDGFTLTHVIEPMMLLDEAEVKRFLPPNHYPLPLNPAKPVTMGAFATPVHYTEAKKAQEMALTQAKTTMLKAWQEFADLFGRHYHPVETYRAEDARVLLLTMGSFGETASVAVDELRARGEKVGLVKLRMWRPFPFEELRHAVQHTDVLAVLDRALSPGGPGGPVCSEVKSALYMQEKKPKVFGFIGGLGGRDMTPEDFEALIMRARDMAHKGMESEFEMIGVRE
ncbi:MAG: transketolase C-terminal domain-containing protein [Dehalococcoidia bacterium]|nr:transketolase C-terminal domain-containing protein [Dehalococcoidia bacterium]